MTLPVKPPASQTRRALLRSRALPQEKDPCGANLDRSRSSRAEAMWHAAGAHHRRGLVRGSRARRRRPPAPRAHHGGRGDRDLYHDVGAPDLTGHWTNDDFDLSQPALCHERVVKVPALHWTTPDAVRNGN